MKNVQLVFLAAGLTLLLAACGKKEEAAAPKADAVAVVNGHEVSRALWDEYVMTRAHRPAKDLGATDRAKLLDDLIEMVLMADAPRAEDKTGRAKIDEQVELTRLALNAQAKAEEITKAEPTEAEIKAEYDSQLKLMQGQSEYLTRHIVVQTREEAESLLAQIQKGADFVKLAAKKSTDKETQEGIVFWVGGTPQDKAFADAVRTLKKGQVAPQPVQSQFGWHVIRLEDTRPMAAPDYEGSKAQIKQTLVQKKFQAAVDAMKKAAKTEKKI